MPASPGGLDVRKVPSIHQLCPLPHLKVTALGIRKRGSEASRKYAQ